MKAKFWLQLLISFHILTVYRKLEALALRWSIEMTTTLHFMLFMREIVKRFHRLGKRGLRTILFILM
ncbi:hypothetical protein GLYMA_13G056066v4 [Glycine max]|nr:hypothetical protein GLYMA_13G056066v4 [Glycine max]KAG4976036.1 hypothetical protein JHK86_035510 [Glycine max]KAH1100000.1 hypothetical protein GYH30_035246 [Glycine max]